MNGRYPTSEGILDKLKAKVKGKAAALREKYILKPVEQRAREAASKGAVEAVTPIVRKGVGASIFLGVVVATVVTAAVLRR